MGELDGMRIIRPRFIIPTEMRKHPASGIKEQSWDLSGKHGKQKKTWRVLQRQKLDAESDKVVAAYLRSRDAFGGPTLEQHLLLQRHLLPKRLLVERLPQVCRTERKREIRIGGQPSGRKRLLRVSVRSTAKVHVRFILLSARR